MIPRQQEPKSLNKRQVIERIRARLTAANQVFDIIASDGQMHLVTGNDIILSFPETTTFWDREFYTRATQDVKILLDLLDAAIAKIKEQKASLPQPETSPDYTTQCVMLCDDPAFKKFMAEKHGLESPLTKERVATRLRSVMRSTERTALNEDEPAANRWKRMVKDFEYWKRHG